MLTVARVLKSWSPNKRAPWAALHTCAEVRKKNYCKTSPDVARTRLFWSHTAKVGSSTNYSCYRNHQRFVPCGYIVSPSAPCVVGKRSPATWCTACDFLGNEFLFRFVCCVQCHLQPNTDILKIIIIISTHSCSSTCRVDVDYCTTGTAVAIRTSVPGTSLRILSASTKSMRVDEGRGLKPSRDKNTRREQRWGGRRRACFVTPDLS